MQTKLKTTYKTFRAKCLDCSNNQYIEVRECPMTWCPNYPYRMGKRPTKADLDAYLNSSNEN